MTDINSTVFALSSGAPPAAIAVVRISGPRAGDALVSLCGKLPEPRVASLRSIAAPASDSSDQPEAERVLDRGLVLWFPGPATATGEDLAELHLHGGRAVVTAVERALSALPGLRKAEPGEFTRRAFTNGRIDLAEADGLADLLAAETELQLAQAIGAAGGAISRRVDGWRSELLQLVAVIETALDFADEEDGAGQDFAHWALDLEHLLDEIRGALARPRAELLRNGFRVAIAGVPNAGKSTLLNAIAEREAAIISPVAGTTRDLIEVAVALDGVPFVFVDTAGLRDAPSDAIEGEGIKRARAAMDAANLVLWLVADDAGSDGDPAPAPEVADRAQLWLIETQIDRRDCGPGQQDQRARFQISARTGEGMDALRSGILAHARDVLPRPGEIALNERQHRCLADAVCAGERAAAQMSSGGDLLVVAEELRIARLAFDRLLGRAGTEDMLDALFSRFCIGK